MAEQALLGALIRDNQIFDLVAPIVRREDFGDSVSAAVYAAIADILEGNVEGVSVADPISVASVQALSGYATVEKLAEWARQASGDHETALSHAHVVHEGGASRRLQAATAKAVAIAGDDRPARERAEAVQQLFAEAGEDRRVASVGLGAAAVAAMRELAERAQAGVQVMGITCGIPDLDALLAGLHPGQLIIVAARPAVGKTAFALCIGLAAAAAGSNVVMASLEMLAPELSKRGVAVLSGVDSHALRIGALSEEDWGAAVDAAERMLDLPFEVVDAEDLTLSSLVAKARRLKREGKLDLLIVDYLQLLETAQASRHTNREQAVAAVSRGLKKLAMRLGIPVIALSQLNRAVEGRPNGRPQMSDLRESGAIEQDADVIMFIHKEPFAAGAEPDHSHADIIVAKQRAGPTGEVRVGYRKRTTEFYPYQGATYEPTLQAA